MSGIKQRRNHVLPHDQPTTYKILVVCMQFLFVSQSYAHGDVHEQINALTQIINKNGPSVSALLKRSDLHRIHKDWMAALDDLEKAENLGASNVDFYRAKILIDTQQTHKAREHLNSYIKKNPDRVEGYYLRSQSWLAEKNYTKSIEDLNKSISLSQNPSPDFYFERAHLLKKLGGENNLRIAITGLEEALSKMGPLISLQELIIQLSIDLKDYPAALNRLEPLLSSSPRKERWYALKSYILLLAGKKEEALHANEQALQAIAALPIRHRNTKAILKLEADLKSKVLVN